MDLHSCCCLQALQKVNERLLEENPDESLLFDVVLITTDSQQQQQSSGIMSSTRHYGNLTSAAPIDDRLISRYLLVDVTAALSQVLKCPGSVFPVRRILLRVC